MRDPTSPRVLVDEEPILDTGTEWLVVCSKLVNCITGIHWVPP